MNTNTGTATIYGTVVANSEGAYVQLDGSEQITPVSLTADVKDGDRVLVEIKDHSAIVTGNITSPGARVDDLNEVANTVTEQESTITVINSQIDIYNSSFQIRDGVVTGIKGITTDWITVSSLEADRANISTLQTDLLECQSAIIAKADIDLANIKTGCITSAMISQEAVGTSQIADGSITDAKIVDLTANKITAGTLSVERLEIRGSTNSIVYELNNISGALQSVNVDTLNGEVLTDRSITTDKIVANAITANEIAARTITANEILANTITGNEIAANTITAEKIDVTNLFAQNITATGTITGITIKGATGDFSGTIYASKGKIANFTISGGYLYNGIGIGTAKSCGISCGSSLNGSDNWIFWAGNGNFRVDINGYANLANADIVGNIIATSIIAYNNFSLTIDGETHEIITANSPASYYLGIDDEAYINFFYNESKTVKILSDTLYVGNSKTDVAEFSGTVIADGLGGSNLGGQFRATWENYGFIIRNDGIKSYLLLTDSGLPYGSFNDLRPFFITNSTGEVHMMTTKNFHGKTRWYSPNEAYYLLLNENDNIIPYSESGNGAASNTVNIGSSVNYFKSVYYGTSLVKASDRRLKNDLGDLTESEALTLLNGFQAKKFTLKSDKQAAVQYGAYAQDVRDLLISSGIGYTRILGIGDKVTDESITDLYADEEDVTYALDYTQYIPVLIKGWQSHQIRIANSEVIEESLQYQLEQAFQEIEKLKAQIQQLQAVA